MPYGPAVDDALDPAPSPDPRPDDAALGPCMAARLLARRRFVAAELVAAHPPVVRDPNKRRVFDAACGVGSVHRGALDVARWRMVPPPDRCPPRAPTPVLRVHAGVFA